ncbi:MAG: DUF485 domain-containing protein [Gemmatimonadaceae bacterium]|nr:DUF485 domain-containing protein [Gemmatimonadaceae bacterium]
MIYPSGAPERSAGTSPISDARLQALAARRWKTAIWLTGAMVAIYFGFIALIAFQKPLMGRLLARGLSVGILSGALVIVSAWLLTWVYVRWANTRYDEELARIIRND